MSPRKILFSVVQDCHVKFELLKSGKLFMSGFPWWWLSSDLCIMAISWFAGWSYLNLFGA